ncbi:MAG TPA: hypothetical protein VEC36_05025 [Patescibacteria group bacterium]|nr:hypothetical protein [Patescibacteria group bacterium]
MFNYIFAVGIILFSLNRSGEKRPLVLKEPCAIVDSTNFKKKQSYDFILTGTYFSIGREGNSYDELKKLKRKYGIKIRGAIDFQSLACTDRLYIPLHDKCFITDMQENTPVKLHCTAYNFYGEDGQLFFYIRKVEVVK